MQHPRATLAAAVMLACLSVTPARAETIEKVVAVVNDDAILLSDLRRRAGPFLQQALTGSESELERLNTVRQLYKQLVQQLVDEELIQQAAEKMHITVTSLEVDQAIDNVRSQNGLELDAFWDAVRNQGFTEKQYRADVRKQLLRLKVINQKVRSRVNITEQTVRDEYEDRLRTARRSQRFRASHIFIPLDETATATDVARAMRTAFELRKRLTPASFQSEMERVGGGDLGWLEQGDLPGVLEEALLELGDGEISAPIRGPQGVHVFFLQERQAGSDAMPAFQEVERAIQNEMLEKAMKRQEELFLAGLRREAVIQVRL